MGWIDAVMSVSACILAWPITLPIAVVLFLGERQESRYMQLQHTLYVENRNRLMPEFVSLVSQRLRQLKERSVSTQDKNNAETLVSDITVMLESMIRAFTSGETNAEDRMTHFERLTNPAIQRRIEFCAANIRDKGFLRQFGALHDIVKRYTQIDHTCTIELLETAIAALIAEA